MGLAPAVVVLRPNQHYAKDELLSTRGSRRGSGRLSNDNRTILDPGNGIISQLLHLGWEIEIRIVIYFQPAICQRSGESLATQRTTFDQVDDLIEHHRPIVNLVGNDDIRCQRGLAGLGAEPQRPILLSHADGADNHLSGTGQHIGTSVDMRLGRLRGKGHITEGSDIVHVNLDIRIGGFRSSDEAIYI